MYSGEYDTPTQRENHDYYEIKLISKELDSVPKYHILEPTRPRSSVLGWYYKGRRFDSHRGQAYFSSLPGVDIHSE